MGGREGEREEGKAVIPRILSYSHSLPPSFPPSLPPSFPPSLPPSRSRAVAHLNDKLEERSKALHTLQGQLDAGEKERKMEENQVQGIQSQIQGTIP